MTERSKVETKGFNTKSTQIGGGVFLTGDGLYHLVADEGMFNKLRAGAEAAIGGTLLYNGIRHGR